MCVCVCVCSCAVRARGSWVRGAAWETGMLGDPNLSRTMARIRATSDAAPGGRTISSTAEGTVRVVAYPEFTTRTGRPTARTHRPTARTHGLGLSMQAAARGGRGLFPECIEPRARRTSTVPGPAGRPSRLCTKGRPSLRAVSLTSSRCRQTNIAQTR